MRQAGHKPGEYTPQEDTPMTATISSYLSPYFPVLLTWHTDTTLHTAVFQTEQEAIDFITSRYGSVQIRKK